MLILYFWNCAHNYLNIKPLLLILYYFHSKDHIQIAEVARHPLFTSSFPQLMSFLVKTFSKIEFILILLTEAYFQHSLLDPS